MDTITAPHPFGPADQIRRTEHFKDQMRWKNIAPMQVINALTRPEKITRVRAHENQWRFCGDGVAVVVSFNRPTPTAVTLYLDEVITPLRDDQRSDPRALASERLKRA